MTQDARGRVLSIVVCGAGPATAIGTFVQLAQDRGWTVQVIATPAAVDFFDKAATEKATGGPVRSQYSKPGTPARRYPTRSSSPRPPTTRSTNGPWASATPMPSESSPRPPA